MIQSDYQECVALMDMPADLRQALRAHERVPAFLSNLERELSANKVGRFLTRTKLKKTVYDLTEFFVGTLKRHADERIMSDAAKAAIKGKAQERKELEEAVDIAEAKAAIDGGPIKLEVPE
jgi:hypothetical protein